MRGINLNLSILHTLQDTFHMARPNLPVTVIVTLASTSAESPLASVTATERMRVGVDTAFRLLGTFSKISPLAVSMEKVLSLFPAERNNFNL